MACATAAGAVFLFLAILLPLSQRAAADDFTSAGAAEETDRSAAPPASDEFAKQWYVFGGVVQSFPRLNDATKEIDHRINRPFRLIAPGFDDVKTFADQRDDMMIASLFLGGGRTISKRWDWFVQAGYSQGEIRTKASNISLLLMPLKTDVTIERSNFFTSLGVSFHPFGMTELGEYSSLKSRLRHAKPFLASTWNWNYLTFDADVKAGFGPFRRLMRVEEGNVWNPWSLGLTTGVDIPVTKHSMLCLNAQYSWFIDQGDDFSGPTLITYWKRFF